MGARCAERLGGTGAVGEGKGGKKKLKLLYFILFFSLLAAFSSSETRWVCLQAVGDAVRGVCAQPERLTAVGIRRWDGDLGADLCLLDSEVCQEW